MARQFDNRFEGLILIGIITGVLLLLLIVGTLAITSVRMRVEQYRPIERISTQTDNPPLDYSSVAYSEENIESVRQLSNDVYLRIRSSMPGWVNNPEAVRMNLNELEKQSNDVCQILQQLRRDFHDTVTHLNAFADPDVTASYFQANDKTGQLLNAIKNYRNSSIQNVSAVMTSTNDDLYNLLPLDDIDISTAIGIWDEVKFQQEYTIANQYLLNLEASIRYFELDVLNRYPVQ